MKREIDVVAALIEKNGKFLLCQRKEDDRSFKEAQQLSLAPVDQKIFAYLKNQTAS